MTDTHDEAWWQADTSRVLPLADGTNEAVVLTNWHWSIYDWLKDGRRWSMRMVMETIGAWDDWEAPASEKLAYYLEYTAEHFIANEEGRPMEFAEAETSA